MLDNVAPAVTSDSSWTHFFFLPSTAMLQVLAILVGTAALWPALRWSIKRVLGRHWSEHHVEVLQQLVFYAVWSAAILGTLRAMNLDLASLGTSPKTLKIVRVGFVMMMASVLAPLARRGLVGLVGRRWSTQQAVLSRRAVTYLVWGLATTTALSELGFDLRFLLGTAGFATFALTYSGQTSLSNIITGLFLIAEQPFVIGDTITVVGITGEVLSIDLLSVKLRTADNLFVRIPNESVLRNTVTNVSHYPIRRLDINISVGYRDDMQKVQRILFDVASRNVLGLEDPKPVFAFVGYGDSGIDVLFCVWGRKETLGDLKNTMYDGIKRAFDEHNVEIPFPHRAIVPGAGSAALPMRMVQGHADVTVTAEPEPAALAAGDDDKSRPGQLRS